MMRMRAAVMYEQGLALPFADSRPLVIEDVELDGPGAGEVLIKVVAAGLCHSDLSAIAGKRKRKVPTVVGHEAGGEVMDTGPGITDLKPSDRVVAVFVSSCGTCRHCLGGRPNLCASSWQARADGTLKSGARRLRGPRGELNHYSGLSTFAEYAVVSRESLIAIDPEVPLAVASMFGCAVVTGVGSVVNSAQVKAGNAVAVIGLGGVGLNALIACVAAGAHPIVAVDVVPEKLALAKELGATHALDGTDAALAEQVHDLTGGGVDYAFETAGAPTTFAAAMALLTRGGTTVTAGLPPPDVNLAVPHAQFVSEGKRIIGSYMGDCCPARDIPRFVELLKAGRLPVEKLHSGSVGFDDLNAGFDRLAEGRVVRLSLAPHGPE